MGGLIFAVIAAFWLMYLVPYFLHSRPDGLSDDEAERSVPFTGSVTIVRSGTSLADADAGTSEVSTPLTRRAQLRELQQIDFRAAQRRRRVLIFLLLVQVIVGTLVVLRIGAWWVATIPAGLIVAFGVVARFSVRTLRADLDLRASRIRECPDEETVAISLSVDEVAEHEHSIELSVPISPVASLWDPIPITRPTYVSKPLAPRTVRTIDLAAPVPAPGWIAVTADPIDVDAAPDADDAQAEEDAG